MGKITLIPIQSGYVDFILNGIEFLMEIWKEKMNKYIYTFNKF